MTWNEIDGCRRDVPRLPPGAFDEVFAVDGGSRDGTREFLESSGIPVHRQDAPSYNAAYHTAFRHAKADAVVFFHPKGTIDPRALARFRPLLDAGADLVIASRNAAGGGNEEDARRFRPRKWFTMSLSLAAALAWRRGGDATSDVLHGMRAMRVDAFRAIAAAPRGVTMDLEMVARCYRLGLRVAEFPVVEEPRASGGTHFRAWPTGRKLIGWFAAELTRRKPRAP